MCGRFYLDVDFDAILDRYGYLSFDDSPQLIKGEIRPTNDITVIHQSNKDIILSSMAWGFSTSFNNRPLINARSESIYHKKTFKKAIMNHRCLIPAKGYYEWFKKGKATVKHRVFLNNHPIFSMAGVFQLYLDEDGTSQYEVSILTKEADPKIEWLHSRMPYILTKENERQFIDPHLKTDDLKTLLSYTPPLPLIAEAMEQEQLSFF